MAANVSSSNVDTQADLELADEMAACMYDPLRFVLVAYDWPINGEPGPDTFQREFLKALGEQVQQRRFNGYDAVLPVRMGTSSGHGIGKSVLSAWIVNWIMSTRPYCKGTVTANTNDQLEKKTWAAVREWTKRCITSHWFEINSNKMYRKGMVESWFCAPASCAEENSEAFAGQHAKDSTSFYIFDEASAIPDKIWEVAEGGLTDGEAMIFAFGNPTRNTGRFHQVAFGSARDRWQVRVIDSRDCKFSNKELIAEWLQDYGDESDFFRVRVRGLPPSASELQYIDGTRVHQAGINVPQVLDDEPLVAGVDVSGGGSSLTVCRFRKGFDARSIKPIRLTGEQTMAHDRQLVVSVLAQALEQHQLHAMFIDAAYGAVIVSRLRQLGYQQVHEVNFGGGSPDPYCDNMRSWMYKQCKDWLPKGAIDQKDHHLAADLTAPGYHLTKSNKLVIESKAQLQKRQGAPLHDSDSLVLTWAMPVRLTSAQKHASRNIPFPSGPGAWLGS